MPAGVQDGGHLQVPSSGKAEGAKAGRAAVYALLFPFQIPHGSLGMLFCVDSSSGPGTYNALILFN